MLKNSSDMLDDQKEKLKNDENDGGHPSLLIPPLGRDASIYCLVRLSRSDYGSIAALNKNFRSLIKTGELYQLRRKMDIVEHWIYFYCNVQWEAYDLNRDRLMELPTISANICFMLSNKESVAVGTELLVFGREVTGPTIYKYSILTNSWLKGVKMNTPRYLFGSASLREIAILAGGSDQHGNILSSSELYNSDTGTWEILPDMNIARRMCSAVFMDEKFYVFGGFGVDNTTQLSCGEEFDLKTRKWQIKPNMCPPRNEAYVVNENPIISKAPPSIAVVNDILYAADYTQQVVKKYVKETNSWITIGSLPDQVASLNNSWGMAFRSCGDKLVVIGGLSPRGGRVTEINAWVADEGAPRWNLLAIIQSGCFVDTCAVMGC